jgi:hypothetical protein
MNLSLCGEGVRSSLLLIGRLRAAQKLLAPEAQRQNQGRQFGVDNPSSIGVKGKFGQRALDDRDSLVFTSRAATWIVDDSAGCL